MSVTADVTGVQITTFGVNSQVYVLGMRLFVGQFIKREHEIRERLLIVYTNVAGSKLIQNAGTVCSHDRKHFE